LESFNIGVTFSLERFEGESVLWVSGEEVTAGLGVDLVSRLFFVGF